MNLEKRARDYSAAAAAPAPDGKSLHARVPDAFAGLRLDQALARLFPAYSRSRLQNWVKSARVTVDGASARARDKVRGGERIGLHPEADPGVPDDLAQNIALTVVYEDRALLVIDKPAGLVVHPGSGNRAGTMLNALLHHASELARLPRAGIVHRLDKDTSGLLAVAKTLEAHTALVRQLQAHTVKREYLALVAGATPPQSRIEASIGRHPMQRTRMAVVERGKPAATRFRTLRRGSGWSLVECSLETGRTHQIRVHMAASGHPLIGDPVYLTRAVARGLPLAAREFKRQALHATRLALVHPATGRSMSWHSPLPADLHALLDRLIRDAAAR
jgi:23S rRNA pseudouridine1911/1915/1917 synthase